MIITSSEFKNNGIIPVKYTCSGEGINPPFDFSEIPSTARSLTLIVEDPDAPSGMFTHWVLFNVPSSVTQIRENQVPQNCLQGMTDFGKTGYGGPCPPPGKSHRYFFRLYAIDKELYLMEEATRDDVLMAMDGHIIDTAELVGLYKR